MPGEVDSTTKYRANVALITGYQENFWEAL